MGYFFALMATLFWAGNAVAARFLAESVPPLGVSFWRWAVALIICIPATYPAFRRNIPAVKEHWKYLLLLAFLGVALFNTLLYTAAHTTTAFNLSVISTVTPVIIFVFSFIFTGESLSRTGFVGFVLASLGILFLITDGRPANILAMKTASGDLIMLLAACVFAAYTVLVRKKPPEITINTMVFATFVMGFFMLLPPYIIQEIFFVQVKFGMPQILGFIYVGVFASFASFMFWNRAVVMIGASRSAAVYYSIPVFSGTLGFILLGESLTYTDITSMFMVGFGVYLTGKQ
ncbi:MAG: EamA/RhaT family transporter [Denitrovibrio sp.]|nr:MAG: EamA/RhaT family transporter [Denitrovibrio sp.]